MRKYALICVKSRTIAWSYIHQRQKNDLERFLYFDQHSIAILDILRRQMSYKREKYIFTSANLQVINAILNANGDNIQTWWYRNHSLIFLPHYLTVLIQITYLWAEYIYNWIRHSVGKWSVILCIWLKFGIKNFSKSRLYCWGEIFIQTAIFMYQALLLPLNSLG